MLESEGNGWVGSDGRGRGSNGGGREWCEVRCEEEQKRTYHSLSSLASAHGCWPSSSGRSSSFSCGRLVGGRLCSWAFVSIRPRLFPFTGVRFHWWASAFVGGHSCSCGGEVESSWPFVMEGLVPSLLRCVVVLRCCL